MHERAAKSGPDIHSILEDYGGKEVPHLLVKDPIISQNLHRLGS